MRGILFRRGVDHGGPRLAKQYVAVSTIAVSSTPYPKAANTVGWTSYSRTSSRRLWNEDRKNPVLVEHCCDCSGHTLGELLCTEIKRNDC